MYPWRVHGDKRVRIACRAALDSGECIGGSDGQKVDGFVGAAISGDDGSTEQGGVTVGIKRSRLGCRAQSWWPSAQQVGVPVGF